MLIEREFVGGKDIQEALLEFLTNRIDSVLASVDQNVVDSASAEQYAIRTGQTPQ